MIRFGEDVCRNLDSALRREWLETNGIGGFASGTINGCNRRRYHGLLVAATNSMLTPERAKLVVAVVQDHLLTPYGLRSLAPSDPQYRGRYTGNGASRDAAYHQGTVWPWLMGPFVTAYIKVNGKVNGGSEAARRQGEEWLAPLNDPERRGDTSGCSGGCLWNSSSAISRAARRAGVRQNKTQARRGLKQPGSQRWAKYYEQSVGHDFGTGTGQLDWIAGVRPESVN